MARPVDYSAAVFLPPPSESEIAEAMASAIGGTYNPDTTLNVMKMMAGTGAMFPALLGMVQAIFTEPEIDDRRRETIILRAAAVLDCPYEWQANEQMAGNAGLTPEQIEAISVTDDSSRERFESVGLPGDFALLAAACDEMLRGGTLTDTTLSALISEFGPSVCRKYVVTISWFSLLSLFLNSTRVRLETTDKIGDRTSPLG